MKLPKITINDEEIEIDQNGYLVDSAKWTRNLAIHLAKKDGFKTLGDDEKHWTVLDLLRDLYRKDMLPYKDGEILFLITKGTNLRISKLHRIFNGLSIPNLLKWAGLPSISCPAGV